MPCHYFRRAIGRNDIGQRTIMPMITGRNREPLHLLLAQICLLPAIGKLHSGRRVIGKMTSGRTMRQSQKYRLISSPPAIGNLLTGRKETGLMIIGRTMVPRQKLIQSFSPPATGNLPIGQKETGQTIIGRIMELLHSMAGAGNSLRFLLRKFCRFTRSIFRMLHSTCSFRQLPAWIDRISTSCLLMLSSRRSCSNVSMICC